MANRALIFHPEAAAEVEAAFDWYAQKSAVAPRSFLIELAHAVETVPENPLRWPLYFENFRRYVLPSFPYVLYYRVLDHKIEIVALAHTKRKQNYWMNR